MKDKTLARSIFEFFLLCSLFTVSLPQVGLAQTAVQTAVAPDLQKALAAVEEKAEARRKELGIPGISLVIVKDGQIIYMKGFGYKDFEKQVAVTPDTQFAIGSATKAFTALSVLMTQDEGKLSIDDSPKKYLPYFKMYDPETDKNIAIRDLLSHSSGLNRTDLAMITGKLNRAELIEVAAQAKPTAKLREKFQYQNIMFTAAGEIVATVQKEPWEKFVRERIFKPLSMANSTMSMRDMQKAKDFSFGYSYNFDTKETEKLPFRDIDQVAPAGSINSTARDMAQWLRFVLNAGSMNGKRLVSEKGFEEWLKPQMKVAGTSSYGFGWFLQKWNGLKVVQHGGNIDGFNSLVAMIPEKKLGFVLLTNVSASPLGNELMPVVWQNLIGENKPAVDPPKVIGASIDAISANGSASAKELVGKYTGPRGGTIEIKQESDGKVTFNIGGQQPYTLNEKTKDSYSMVPLPDAYLLKAKRNVAGKIASVVVTQPEGDFEFRRSEEKPEDKPKIAVNELMQKTIEAAGGEANWRKITTRVSEFDLDLENQGVKGYGTSYAKAPNKGATKTTLTALGKTIATGFDRFDGTGGEESYSFAPVDKYTGKRLDDARLGADFYSLLDWKTNFKKVEITGVGKVGDEEAFIVAFEPEKGTNFTEYYSTKTFLLLKREGVVPSSTSEQQLPYVVTYSDYRSIDGIVLPFKTVNYSIANGNIVTTLRSVKHNVPVDDSTFAPRSQKPARK